MNLRNVGDSKFTVHHTVLVEMYLRLKPTGFSPWVVHWVLEQCYMAFTPCLEGSEVGEKEAVGCRVQRLLFYH